MTRPTDGEAVEDRAAGDSGGSDADGSLGGTDGESEGYVHRPSGEPPAAGGDRTFDWRGWVLVATIAFSFVAVPGALLALPSAQSFVASLGLSLRDAYLTLPLVPAFLLGAVAVWSAVRSRSV